MGTGQISKTLSYGPHAAVVYGELSDCPLALPLIFRRCIRLKNISVNSPCAIRVEIE